MVFQKGGANRATFCATNPSYRVCATGDLGECPEAGRNAIRLAPTDRPVHLHPIAKGTALGPRPSGRAAAWPPYYLTPLRGLPAIGCASVSYMHRGPGRPKEQRRSCPRAPVVRHVCTRSRLRCFVECPAALPASHAGQRRTTARRFGTRCGW